MWWGCEPVRQTLCEARAVVASCPTPLQHNHSNFYACPLPELPRGCSTRNVYIFLQGRARETRPDTHTQTHPEGEGKIGGNQQRILSEVWMDGWRRKDPLPSPPCRHSVVNRLAPPGLLITQTLPDQLLSMHLNFTPPTQALCKAMGVILFNGAACDGWYFYSTCTEDDWY